MSLAGRWRVRGDYRGPRRLDLVQRLRRGGTATPVLMLTARDTPAGRIVVS